MSNDDQEEQEPEAENDDQQGEDEEGEAFADASDVLAPEDEDGSGSLRS